MPNLKFFGIASEVIEVALPPDRITDLVKTVFTQGQCHSFALAINRLTNWPIYGGFQFVWEWESNSPSHMFCKSPSLGYIDINGPINQRWLIQARIKRISVSHAAHPPEGYLHPNIDAALPYAREVLRQIGELK